VIDIAILRAMAGAGAPVEAILAAIEADQRSEIARVQARRIADRERQRRRRHADTGGQSVTPRDTADTSLSLTSSLSSSNIEEIKKEQQERKKDRRAPARKFLLPDDWMPKASHYAKGDPRFIDRKADDMRNWAKSKAVMRADWDATFHGFLRPERDGNGGANGRDRQRGESLGDLGRRLADEARQLEFAAGVGRPDDAVRGH
jgi:hypothetical protein